MVKRINNVQHEYLHETFVNFNFKSTLKTLEKWFILSCVCTLCNLERKEDNIDDVRCFKKV
jgi:hypothetical protein